VGGARHGKGAVLRQAQAAHFIVTESESIRVHLLVRTCSSKARRGGLADVGIDVDGLLGNG
jgi:hypothetical protein